MLLMRMKRVSLTRSCYFNSMAMKLLGFILLTVFQCFFRRIFATTLKHSDLRAVTTWLIKKGISQTWMKLLWAILYLIRGVKAHKPCAVRVLSMAIRRNGRKWFVRLHNFNSNSENYINPVDGIKTNLAPTGQSPTSEGRSRVQVETREKEIQEELINQKTPTQNEFLLVPEVTIYLWSRYLKGLWTERSGKWGMRILKENSYKTAHRWFVQLNYESHGTPNDFTELPTCGSKFKFKGRILPSFTF